MKRPALHLFVCTNERPAAGKPSCGARGAGAVLAALQREIGARPSLWGRAAVTPCGCLGPCFEGPNVAAYPMGVFYSGVTPGDAGAIVEAHGDRDEPLERLRYRFEDEDEDEDDDDDG
jgi:(2Fe-2S) ferredoxin